MKKKKLIGLLLVCVVVSVVGIMQFRSSNTQDKTSKPVKNQTENKINVNAKSLVVYFSVPETDNPNNMTRDEDNSTVVVDGKVLGNTEYLATLISEKTKSDLFRLEPKNAYPTNHQELLQRAKDEMENDERVELKENIDLTNYEVIYLGYPIWNADLPPVIQTFLENNDFSNKTIIPFCSHGGSGLSRTPETIKEKLKDSKVITNGFEVYRSDIEEASNELDAWLKELN